MIDTLTEEIRKISSDPVALKLVELFESWKTDDSTVEELESDIERYIGNSWITSEEEHKDIYSLWSKFKENEISHIAGMTMNERLFTFGLFDRFEKINSEAERLNIYTKLHAKP